MHQIVKLQSLVFVPIQRPSAAGRGQQRVGGEGHAAGTEGGAGIVGSEGAQVEGIVLHRKEGDGQEKQANSACTHELQFPIASASMRFILLSALLLSPLLSSADAKTNLLPNDGHTGDRHG